MKKEFGETEVWICVKEIIDSDLCISIEQSEKLYNAILPSLKQGSIVRVSFK